MARSNNCPAPEELERILLGELSSERSAEIEQHLNWCDACLLALENVHVESKVVHQLKKQPREQPCTEIADLGPLSKMSTLTVFDCRGCPIASLEPLTGTALKELQLDFRPERDAALLKRLTTLTKINGLPVKDFWQKKSAD